MAVGENDLMTAGACACSDARTGASEARPSGEARPCAGVPGEACSCAPPSGEARPCALEVASLDLSWDGAAVCRDISFRVETGEVVCLVGRSGSGKTTLFHAIAGLTRPDAGRVLLGGEDITGRPGRVSYMLQKDLLIEQRCVLDNVAVPLIVKGVPWREARAQARSLFAEFGLAGSEQAYPAQLSGGMRQRAALLRTYLMDNEVVLMDEPFSALDAFTRADMRRWFLAMLTRLGLSSVLVTHDVDEAIAMADRILVLRGDPARGVPSTIAGSLVVGCPRSERDDFVLTDAALALKRAVLAALGNA